MAPFLVTGATGFIGRFLLDSIDHPMRAAVRSEARFPAPVYAVGDMDGGTDWRAALKGAAGVVHCAALASGDDVEALRRVNVEATVNLARQAVEAGAPRFIFLSTALIDVQPLTEYARSKLEAEEALRQIAGLEPVFIRPPIVIGKGAKGNLGLLTKVMRKGLPLPLGLATKNRRDVVSRETVARLIAACMTDPTVVGKTLYPTDGRVSTRGMIERLGAEEGVAPRFLPVPTGILTAALAAVGKRAMVSQLFGDSKVDGSEASRVMAAAQP